MNARQKVKRLKKEIEKLKADKTNGYKWLKIDDMEYETEGEYDPFCVTPKIFLKRIVKITCGQTKLIGEIAADGDLIFIDSSKLDANYDKAREVMQNDRI